MKRQLWIVVALLVLASLACAVGGGGNGGETPAPATGGQTQPTGPTAATGPAGETEPAPEVTAGALENLDSYRLRMTWEWLPDGGSAETMTMEQEVTRDPAARRIVMTSTTEQGTLEMVQIGDTMWTCMLDTCMQTEATEEAMTEFGSEIDFDPATYTGSAGYDYVGEDTVNGLRARHYRLNLTPAEVAALSTGAVVSDVQADMWVASQSGLSEFVTRFTMTWREDRSGTLGNASMVFDVYDVNAPITIAPPEGATTGMPEGLPEYPGATELTLMGTMISFNTTDDPATVAGFYRTQLPTLGWTNQSDQDLGGSMVMQTWSDGSRTLNIMISAAEGGGSSVLLTLE